MKRYQVILPNGETSKPHSRREICRWSEARKIPNGSEVLVDGGPMRVSIDEFCAFEFEEPPTAEESENKAAAEQRRRQQEVERQRTAQQNKSTQLQRAEQQRRRPQRLGINRVCLWLLGGLLLLMFPFAIVTNNTVVAVLVPFSFPVIGAAFELIGWLERMERRAAEICESLRDDEEQSPAAG